MSHSCHRVAYAVVAVCERDAHLVAVACMFDDVSVRQRVVSAYACERGSRPNGRQSSHADAQRKGELKRGEEDRVSEEQIVGRVLRSHVRGGSWELMICNELHRLT